MGGRVEATNWDRNSMGRGGIVGLVASEVDDGAQCADEAIGALAGHLAQRRSLLAWTMRWCPDGDASWATIWSSATNVKAMINVLVLVGVIRRVAVRAGASHLVGTPVGHAIVRFTATCGPDGRAVDESVRADGLAGVLRREFARPLLDVIVTAAQRA